MKICSTVLMLLRGGTNGKNGEASRSGMYQVIACCYEYITLQQGKLNLHISEGQ